MRIKDPVRLLYGVMLIAGVWLFASPFWMESYASSTGFAVVHSHVVGLLAAALGTVGWLWPTRWSYSAAVGVVGWQVVGPFVVGFITTAPGPAWNHMITGIVLVYLLMGAYGSSQRKSQAGSSQESAEEVTA